jgi:di/tricarboxylate transporter
LAEYQIWIVFAILLAGIGLFASQRVRYDIVAIMMLLTVGLVGILSFDELFLGFASPAVITVAAALVMARALYNSGILDRVEEYLFRFDKRPLMPLLLLLVVVAVMSGFINNMAALAITLPVALSLSSKLKLVPSKILIPLAFASIVGGSLTLIGTPSNIVIGAIAREELGRSIDIFEFAVVGVPLIAVFIGVFVVIGRRLLPERTSPYGTGEKFQLPKYVIEFMTNDKSKFVGKTIRDLEIKYDFEIEVVRISRADGRRELPHFNARIEQRDVLLIRTEAVDLESFVKETGLEVAGKNDKDYDPPEEKKEQGKEEQNKEKTRVVEAVVLPQSPLIDRTAKEMFLRDWLNITILGVSRHGSSIDRRISNVRMAMGDVLLLEVQEADMQRVFQELKCAPLHTRGISLHARAPPMLTLLIAGVGIALSALGFLPIEIALALSAGAMVLSKSITFKEAYDSIHWPIIILIGALIPFGVAMDRTGADNFVAEHILQFGISEPVAALAIIFGATLVLSNVINNVAAAVFMAPVAIRLSEMLGISGFPMVMGVAFASALPFLTPIGHQSSLLVMEAGGYKFSDYLRFGLPLTAACTVVVLLIVPVVWPF